MYEKLKEIYEMVDMIINNGDNPDMGDEVTMCQCELPHKLNEMRDFLFTMIE